jgi:hypothetical protein
MFEGGRQDRSQQKRSRGPIGVSHDAGQTVAKPFSELRRIFRCVSLGEGCAAEYSAVRLVSNRARGGRTCQPGRILRLRARPSHTELHAGDLKVDKSIDGITLAAARRCQGKAPGRKRSC